MTGTAGVIFEDVVRDIGRDSGRVRESPIIARGTAGAVNPGGIVGVARRTFSKSCVLKGVIGAMCTASFSLSLTNASTLNNVCSSSLNGVSPVCSSQH